MNAAEVVIVGAGPCGLACGIECHRAGLSHLIIDKGSVTDAVRRYPVNGQFFSTADKLAIGGLPFPAVHMRPTRIEALQYYRMAAEYFSLNLQLHTTVADVSPVAGGFVVNTSRGAVQARHVIIATGYYDLPRPLPIPGGDLPHVARYYTEPYGYVRTRTAILGGGNSAIEAALDLFRHGVQVEMFLLEDDFVPTAKYWLLPDIRNRVKAGDIVVHRHARAEVITPDAVHVRHADGQRRTHPADFVLALIGYRPDADLLRRAGIVLHGEALIPQINPDTFETNVPGLYVAGSVVGGEETAKVFIENGRHHGQAILSHILQQRTEPARALTVGT